MSCRTHNCLTHCPVLTRGVLQLGRNLHVSLDHWSASLTSSVLELDQNELQQVAALTCFSVLARRQSCSVSRGCAARSQVLPPLPLPVMMKWKLCCTGVSNAEETCFSRSPTLCPDSLWPNTTWLTKPGRTTGWDAKAAGSLQTAATSLRLSVLLLQHTAASQQIPAFPFPATEIICFTSWKCLLRKLFLKEYEFQSKSDLMRHPSIWEVKSTRQHQTMSGYRALKKAFMYLQKGKERKNLFTH